MEPSEKSTILSVDLRLLEAAVESESRDALDAALRSMMSHLDVGEGVEAARRMAAKASREVTRDVPALVWTVLLVEALPTLADEELDAFYKGSEVRKAHFYQPIACFVKAVLGAAGAYFDFHHRDYSLSSEPIRAALNLVSALAGWHWAKTHSEEYLHWWGTNNWGQTQEGPPPTPGPASSPEEESEAMMPESIKVVIRGVADWLRAKLGDDQKGD